jgi:hypothetical protein
MELALPWPTTNGEWLAWGSGVFTALLGLLYLFAPRLMLRAGGLLYPPDRPQSLAHVRGPVAGFLLGTGLAAVLSRSRSFISCSASPGRSPPSGG